MTIKEYLENISIEDVKSAIDRFKESIIFTSISTALITALSAGYTVLQASGNLDPLKTEEFWTMVGFTLLSSFVSSILLAGNRVRRHINNRSSDFKG